MAERRPLVAGNWKMNGLTRDGLALARAVVGAVREQAVHCEVVLCPPATLLAAVAGTIGAGPVALGGQDCHPAPSGAYTGDIAAEMLADLGCRFVIVGHSERRQAHGETDAVVRDKAAAAHRAGLVAIVCVGETLAERDAGETLAVVRRQVTGSLPEGWAPENTVIAYEPVWAIGSGRTPTTREVSDVHRAIRDLLGPYGARARILYGGSVKPDNAAELLAIADVDGALVGGASLKAADFVAIARNCR